MPAVRERSIHLARTKRYVSDEEELRQWRDALDYALRKHKSRTRKLLRGMAIVLVVSVVAAGGGAGYLWSEVERRLVRSDVDVDARLGGVMNILVIGSDSREGVEDPDDVQRFGTVGGRRADSIILVQAVPTERRAVLLNFPRDLYVDISGRGSKNRINSAYEDGASAVVDTVRQLTGVPIHHYVEVNLIGFRNMVDALGGIEVCLDQPMRDRTLGLQLPEGPVHLDGNAALSFVRSRYATADGDFGRIKRQQQFLRAVVGKLGRPSVLLNPLKVRRLANTFAENVTADRDFSLGEMIQLAPSVRSFSPEQMQSFTVPGTISSARGMSIVRMDEEPAERLFAALRENTDPAQALAPAPVEVTVEDASGRGLASTVAEELERRGFDVAYGPADTRQARTEVTAPSRMANEAKRLHGLVPDAQLRYTGSEIKLVLGSDFDGFAPAPRGEEPQPGGPCDGFVPGG